MVACRLLLRFIFAFLLSYQLYIVYVFYIFVPKLIKLPYAFSYPNEGLLLLAV